MRLGELMALTWDDVDWSIQRVHVRRSYCLTSKTTKLPKSRKRVNSLVTLSSV